MHPYTYTIQISRRRNERSTSPSLLAESWGSPFLLFLLPEGRTLKTKRSKGTKSRARRRSPLGPVPVALSPPPQSPVPGRRGRSGARGPALLRQNKAHRGRPRPRTKLVTKASARRRAPSLRSYSVGREGGLKDGVRFAPVFQGLRHLAPVYSMTRNGDSAFTSSLSRTPISLSLVSCPHSPPSLPFFLHLPSFTLPFSFCLFFKISFHFFPFIEKQC